MTTDRKRIPLHSLMMRKALIAVACGGVLLQTPVLFDLGGAVAQPA